MKIRRVTFLGVRGVADATIDLTDPETGAARDLVVVAGPSASGKTRALEAIAAAKDAMAPPVQQSLEGEPWIAPGSAAAKVAIAFELDEEEQTYAAGGPVIEGEVTFLPESIRVAVDDGLAAVLDRYDHERRVGKLEYFPATRRVPVIPPFMSLEAYDQRRLRGTKEARKYGFVVRFLRDIEDDAARGNAFAAQLAALSPTCRWERSSTAEGLPRCFRSRDGALLTAAELSDFEADAVLFAATATGIQLDRSIVLVDRPELFASPAEVPRFIAALGALGEGSQLWLASNAPAVAEVKGAHVVRLAAATAA